MTTAIEVMHSARSCIWAEMNQVCFDAAVNRLLNHLPKSSVVESTTTSSVTVVPDMNLDDVDTDAHIR